ncbi:ATP-dependent helicase [Motilibacter rhizosphaerae]|nr:ATP-dependent DNA helicase [Motilibacter rhizosphaerae]
MPSTSPAPARARRAAVPVTAAQAALFDLAPPPGYVLVPGATAPSAPPVLDAAQAAVAAHRDGPLLVLAGPGTGKTTTLVESVASLVEDPERPLDPASVLVLTFSRRAADELRSRTTARLGRPTGAPVAWTFHSFAYALVRAHAPAEGEPLRLLSAPEQEVVVAELLRGSQEGEGSVRWPDRLAAALSTRGMADEVRAVLARARELGLEPPDLQRAARAAGREDWAAVAEFQAEYLDVLDSSLAVDYAELVHRAGLLAEQPAVRAALRERYRAVLVDEYQDTDPAQERLLRALAGDGRHLVAVGDPDQSIYAFRGADVSGILEFPTRFPQHDGTPAPVRTLAVSRRAGERLLAASRSVASRVPVRALPRDAVRAHRALAPGSAEPGEVRVLTFPTAAAEAGAVADLLRRAHLEDGTPWGRMAVLVRSGPRSVPLLRRVLGAAGVPVEVAGDELPLAQEPAVAPLLLALRVAAGMGADGGRASTDQVRTLLLSPLCSAEPGALRSLARELRAQQRTAGLAPASSDELLRTAVEHPEELALLEDRLAAPVRRLGRLLERARQSLADGGTGEQALWALWSGTAWGRRLERAARAGGPAGRSADRDLDAVCALFEAAARLEQRPGVRGARLLLEELEAQRIPGDTLAERAVRGEAVRVLTAHRSKGLEWDVVAVVGVQEGSWPDLRRRGSLLEPDRLGVDGLVEPPSPSDQLAEERRLLYVAVTRARRLLVVTAVASGDDDGERPSRFLEELGVPVEPQGRRARRPLTAAGLVAELRRVAVDPDEPEGLRRAARARLARLAAATDAAGLPLVPAAHPSRWWGLVATSDPGRPLLAEGAPVALSGSTLQRLGDCPLAWFLEHEAAAVSARTTALGFGSIVHVLADEVARGTLPADPAVLDARIDAVWSELAFEARWQSAQQRAEASAAVRRFLDWHALTAQRGRRLLGSEERFEVQVVLPDGPVRLRGSADRLELDGDGRLHVVDFKTGRSAPGPGEVARHPQLGAYQLAVEHGAFADLPGAPPAGSPPGGAELVHLRLESAGSVKVQSQAPLQPADDGGPSWAEELVADAAGAVRAERFAPTPGEQCSRCSFRRACPAQPEGRQVVE